MAHSVQVKADIKSLPSLDKRPRHTHWWYCHLLLLRDQHRQYHLREAVRPGGHASDLKKKN